MSITAGGGERRCCGFLGDTSICAFNSNKKRGRRGLGGGSYHAVSERARPAPIRRCVGASLETRLVLPFLTWCVTPRLFSRLRTALEGTSGPPPRMFGAVRLRLRLRVAPFYVRARCVGVVHVGCAARRIGCGAAQRAAAGAVEVSRSSVASRGGRARCSAFARGARRARRVCGGCRVGGEKLRVGCALARRAGWRMARGGVAAPWRTHARAAGACFGCPPARETCAGACQAPHGLHGVSGARGGVRAGRPSTAWMARRKEPPPSLQVDYKGAREHVLDTGGTESSSSCRRLIGGPAGVRAECVYRIIECVPDHAPPSSAPRAGPRAAAAPADAPAGAASASVH